MHFSVIALELAINEIQHAIELQFIAQPPFYYHAIILPMQNKM